MTKPIESIIGGTRSLQRALGDLSANYQKRPTATLARMIQQLKAEIAIRRDQKRR